MKTTKRFLSIMIIAIMTFCLGAFNVSALDGNGDAADSSENKNYSIIVNNDSSTTSVSIKGQTFKAYKILDAVDLNGSFEYQYKSGCLGFDNTPKLISDDGKYSIATLQGYTKESEMQVFADYAYESYIKGKADNGKDDLPAYKTVVAEAESVTFEGLDPGYYLIFGEATNPNGATDNNLITSLVMCKTADANEEGRDITVKLKLGAPSLDKFIQHNEFKDNKDENYGWGKVGDNQIGETVNFKLECTVPDVNGYDVTDNNKDGYTYVIHDTMDNGLTFKEITGIVINNNEEKVLSSDYYSKELSTDITKTMEINGKSIDYNSDKHNLHIKIDVKKAIQEEKIAKGDTLTIYYSAILNENALIASSISDSNNHNDNAAYLEYSNNPYVETSTGKTPEKEVWDWTFTFEIYKKDVNKATVEVNGEKTEIDQPLANAEFTLKKNVDNATNIKFIDVTKAATYDDDGNEIPKNKAYRVATDEEINDSRVTKTEKIVTPLNGKITITGLDDGEYVLKETNAPDKYIPLKDDIIIKIKAEYKEDIATKEIKQLSKLEANEVLDKDDDGNPITKNDGLVNVSSMLATISNKGGSTLVGTGGIGTTIFYIVGGALMAGAVVLLIVRKRINNK